VGHKQPESVLIYVARSNRVRLHGWEVCMTDFSAMEGLRSRLLYRRHETLSSRSCWQQFKLYQVTAKFNSFRQPLAVYSQFGLGVG
jgi:hypothetical protein